jgi:hypothetical protein
MTTATEMLALYVEAERKVLAGQSVSFAGRQLTRVDLDKIREGRREWERRVADETVSSSGGTPGMALADFSCFRG